MLRPERQQEEEAAALSPPMTNDAPGPQQDPLPPDEFDRLEETFRRIIEKQEAWRKLLESLERMKKDEDTLENHKPKTDQPPT